MVDWSAFDSWVWRTRRTKPKRVKRIENINPTCHLFDGLAGLTCFDMNNLKLTSFSSRSGLVEQIIVLVQFNNLMTFYD